MSRELLEKDGEVKLIDGDNLISLNVGVQRVAMSVLNLSMEFSECNDAEEKERLKSKIEFYTKILDSLSNALNAIN